MLLLLLLLLSNVLCILRISRYTQIYSHLESNQIRMSSGPFFRQTHQLINIIDLMNRVFPENNLDDIQED